MGTQGSGGAGRAGRRAAAVVSPPAPVGVDAMVLAGRLFGEALAAMNAGAATVAIHALQASLAVAIAATPGSKANPLLPLPVAAKRLGCSYRHAWRLWRAGAFPGARVQDGGVKVPEQDVLAYARQHGPAPVQPPRPR